MNLIQSALVVKKNIDNRSEVYPPLAAPEATRAGYNEGIAETGAILRGDMPNFTDIVPVRQISEIVG